jgi:hypothetical protein
MDKYDMAYAIFHEMAAHLDNDRGSAALEHTDFGSQAVTVGLGQAFYGRDAGFPTVTEGTTAWKFVEQLLTQKIKDGNGTTQNSDDLQYMLKQDKKNKKKDENQGN